MLRSLVANDLEGWVIHIFVEPSQKQSEIGRIAEAVLGRNSWHLHCNEKRLGVKRNPFHAQHYVFELGSELNIYLEEDLLLAPDVTRLASWYAKHCEPNEVCLNLITGGCVSSGLVSYPGHDDVVVGMGVFNSLGFVASVEQWRQYIKPHWFDFPFGVFSSTGGRLSDWDCAINAYVMSRPELTVVQPIGARVLHIGRDDGEHCDGVFNDRVFSDMYLAEMPITISGYRKCEDWMELPQTVRTHLWLWKEMAGQQRIGRRLARRLLWPWYRFKAVFRSWRSLRR